jgi:peptide/nickel transport system permease protein
MLTRRLVRRYLKLVVSALFVVFFMIVGFYPAPFQRLPETQMHIRARLQGPSPEFWFGTDMFGRDIYSRVVVGTRITYTVSVGAVLIAVVGGVALGIAGGLSRQVGFLVMRLVDILICFPPIIIAIFALSLMKPGVVPLILVIGFLYAPRMARVVQSAVLEVVQLPYIEAQRAVGTGLWRIVRRGILPQIMAPIIVQATIMLATAMLLEAGLSFLGLGIRPPTPTWGALISEARRVMHINISLLVFPSLVLSANVIFINLLGDGLRDFLDPKMRRAQ